MFRVLVDKPIYGNGLHYVEASCTSDDTKTEGNYVTGSICTEVDTGNVFFFNEDGDEGSKWVEQFTFQQE